MNSRLDLLIHGGMVVMPWWVRRRDLGIVDGRFVIVEENISESAAEVIDATGLHIFPGILDAHVHFKEPGRTEWEGLASGSAALAAGGGTWFSDMPLNSSPPVTGAAAFHEKRRLAEQKSVTDFSLWGGLVPGNIDRLAELHDSSSGPGSTDRMKSVTHKVDGNPVQRALYTYWDDGQFGGHGGCLKTVAIQHYNTTTAGWDTVREHYYRYYEPGDVDGPAGALKYAFGPAAVARLRQEFPTSWDSMASGVLLRPYADLRFTYDGARRVLRERIHGFSVLYEFDYLTTSVAPETTGQNGWHTRTIETLPDGSTNTVLSNTAGRTLLHVFTETGTNKQWPRAWEYWEGDDKTGRLKVADATSAIETFSIPEDAADDWDLNLMPDTGPVVFYDYFEDDDTVSPGRFKSVSIQPGFESASRVLLRERMYDKADGSSTQVTPLVSEQVFNAHGPDVSTTVHYGYQYNGAGFTGSTTSPEDIEIPIANDVSSDIVFEQEKPVFDGGGNVVFTTRWLRLHSTGTTDAGELVGPADTGPQALRSYTAFWPDGIGRVHSVANYGTNGGDVVSRPAVCPPASDSILVSRNRWLVSGGNELYERVAPDGIVTRWENDSAGRRIRLWENYDASKGTEHLDANRLTEYTYHISGQLSILTAWNRKGTGDPEEQSTRWAYGTTLTESGIATGHLLRAKIYPESDDTAGTPPGNGPDGTFRRSEFRYNQLGETTKFTDPAQTAHDYTFDQHGRPLDDAVTLPSGSPLDASVLRISRTYADDGRSVAITSWDAATGGSQVNQVKLEFNSWGQLTHDWQSHGSSGVGFGVPVVQYAYADGSSSPGPLNSLRRTAMLLPDGREVAYGFDSGFDDRLGRLSSIGYRLSDNSVPAELSLTYAGVAMPVQMAYPQPGLQWTLLFQSDEETNGGKIPYTGLDRFGRLIQARWLNTAATETRVHVNYWYDRGSRRTKRQVPNAPGGTKEAESYTYDGLSQVTGRKRGTPKIEAGVFTGVDGTPQREELFKYDVLGNWQRYTVLEPFVEGHLPWPEEGTPPTAQTILFDQNRIHNTANQITGFSNTDHYLAHDPAGNLTASAPTPDNDWSNGMSYQWDAWNRLVGITFGDNVIRHAYDGLTRRTTLTENGSKRHFYYNDQWRSVEERLSTEDDIAVTETSPERQHLFNPLNRWHLILRDRNTNPDPGSGSSSDSASAYESSESSSGSESASESSESSSGSASSSTDTALDERLYCLHDAMDPVAITDALGVVVERHNFSAFGMRRVMAVDFADILGGTEKAWNWKFHGEFADAGSSFSNYGYRYYCPVAGRWASRDPLRVYENTNLYHAIGNIPITERDLFGLTGMRDRYYEEPGLTPLPLPPPPPPSRDQYRKASDANVSTTDLGDSIIQELHDKLCEARDHNPRGEVTKSVREYNGKIGGVLTTSSEYGRVNVMVKATVTREPRPFKTVIMRVGLCHWESKHYTVIVNATYSVLPDVYDFDPPWGDFRTFWENVATSLGNIGQRAGLLPKKYTTYFEGTAGTGFYSGKLICLSFTSLQIKVAQIPGSASNGGVLPAAAPCQPEGQKPTTNKQQTAAACPRLSKR